MDVTDLHLRIIELRVEASGCNAYQAVQNGLVLSAMKRIPVVIINYAGIGDMEYRCDIQEAARMIVESTAKKTNRGE